MFKANTSFWGLTVAPAKARSNTPSARMPVEHPPRTPHGTTVSIDLAAIGLPRMRLHVRVAVGPLLAE
jgi:hypothetical protein